ncbi:MAG: PIN domain-containing protein [Actinobacteria bacterium]|nr:PIN domain-containing protein [Actinomycetota bacterium]
MVAVCLDSSAVVSLLIQERGWQAVHAVLQRVDSAFLPCPGLAEVITTTREKGNVSTGPEIAEALRGQGVEFAQSTEADLIEAADLLEMSATHPGPPGRNGRPATLSMADALIIAAAQRLGAPVLTRDRYWSDLAHAGLIRVTIHTF